jgi:hypothetical protein
MRSDIYIYTYIYTFFSIQRRWWGEQIKQNGTAVNAAWQPGTRHSSALVNIDAASRESNHWTLYCHSIRHDLQIQAFERKVANTGYVAGTASVVVIRLRTGPTARNKRGSSSPQSSDRHCGLPSFCSIGTEALALEAQRPWREAKHSPQSSAKGKDECSY